MKTPEEIAATEFNVNPIKMAEKTFELLESQGLVFPPSPDTIGEKEKQFPTSFGDLTPHEIMDKVATFTALVAYTIMLEATAKGEVAALERKLETYESQEYILADTAQVTTKKALRDVSDSVVSTKESLTKAEIRYNVVRAQKEIYEKYLFALSRYITVTMSELNLQ
jgi:hypothetical protein